MKEDQLELVTGGSKVKALKSLLITAGNLAKGEIADLERIAWSFLKDPERGSKEWRRVTMVDTMHFRRLPGAKKPEVRIDALKSF